MAEESNIPAPTSGSDASAPTLNPASAPAESSNTAASTASSASEPKRDPAGSREAEAQRGARALQMLKAGTDPRQVQKALSTATPDETGRDARDTGAAGTGPEASADKRSDGTAGAGESKTPSQSANASAPAPANEAKGVTYSGLNAKQVQALSQAGILPEPGEWSAFPPNIQQRMIASAKVIIAERTRNWQQSQSLLADRDDKGRFAPGKGADGSRARTEQDDDAAGESQPPPAQKKNAPRGSASPVDSVASIRKFAEQFGDPEIAQPLVEAFEAQQRAHAQELETRDRRLNYLQRKVLGDEEKSARDGLSKLVPDLGKDEALWQTVLDAGRVVAEASQKSGANWTWAHILDQTGRAMFAETVATAAQSRLADQRKESLQGTVERAGNETRPTRTMTPKEKAEKARALLKAGKNPREVRDMLSG